MLTPDYDRAGVQLFAEENPETATAPSPLKRIRKGTSKGP